MKFALHHSPLSYQRRELPRVGFHRQISRGRARALAPSRPPGGLPGACGGGARAPSAVPPRQRAPRAGGGGGGWRRQRRQGLRWRRGRRRASRELAAAWALRGGGGCKQRLPVGETVGMHRFLLRCPKRYRQSCPSDHTDGRAPRVCKGGEAVPAGGTLLPLEQRGREGASKESGRRHCSSETTASVGLWSLNLQVSASAAENEILVLKTLKHTHVV